MENFSQASGYRRQRRSRRPLVSDINITPFVDVILVLLIVFMVTAPMLVTGVDINLPKTSASNLPAVDRPPIVVTLKQNGQINIDNVNLETDQLVETLQKIVADRGTLDRLWLRSDKSLNYGRVLEIIALLQEAGFTNIALASLPN